MSQLRWTYIDDYGRLYKVGLYHGSSSGHLMIHCNKKIVVIDFNVLSSKDYKIFLGEELFSIGLEKESDAFSYSFKMDLETETSKNKERKRLRKKHIKINLLIILGIVCLTGLVTFLFYWLNSS